MWDKLFKFFFFGLLSWVANEYWVKVFLFIIFSFSFIEKKYKDGVRNIPLMLFNFWVGAYTIFICYKFRVVGQYGFEYIIAYFNFLCMLFFYKIIVDYLDKEDIYKILLGMRAVIIVTLLYCTLQFFGLDQFFRRIDFHHTHNNLVTGFLGNGTVLSGFLGMSSPLFFIKFNRLDKLSIFLLCIILSQTGMTIGDPSIAGPFILIVVSYFFLFSIFPMKKRIILTICCFFIALIAFIFLPKSFFSFSGRLDLWAYYWDIFKFKPLTGVGLGQVAVAYKQTPFPEARYLHLEYFQLMIELGLIGLVLFINIVKEFFFFPTHDKMHLVVKSIFLGFLVNCFLGFPAHLWLVSTWAVFAYASGYKLSIKDNLVIGKTYH